MPAPSVVTYSVEAKTAANAELLTLLDAGSANATIKLYTDADDLIAEIPLDDPAGAVDVDTGSLVLAIDGTDTALITGECTYAEIADSDGNVHVTLPVAEGNEGVDGFLVLNALVILQGVTVTIVEASVG